MYDRVWVQRLVGCCGYAIVFVLASVVIVLSPSLQLPAFGDPSTASGRATASKIDDICRAGPRTSRQSQSFPQRAEGDEGDGADGDHHRVLLWNVARLLRAVRRVRMVSANHMPGATIIGRLLLLAWLHSLRRVPVIF